MFKLVALFLLFASPAFAQFSGGGSFSNTAALPIYDTTGAQKTPSHGVVGTCTMTLGSCTVTLTGAAAFTDATTYTCSSSDQTLSATLSSISLVSGSQFTVYGVLSHVIKYTCTGW